MCMTHGLLEWVRSHFVPTPLGLKLDAWHADPSPVRFRPFLKDKMQLTFDNAKSRGKSKVFQAIECSSSTARQSSTTCWVLRTTNLRYVGCYELQTTGGNYQERGNWNPCTP